MRRASSASGPTAAELAAVQAQLRARFVFDGDSVTDVAHQLGYFATIGALAGLARVVRPAGRGHRRRRPRGGAGATSAADNRTIGVFEPTGRRPERGAADGARARSAASWPTASPSSSQANRLIPAVSLAIGVHAGAIADPEAGAGHRRADRPGARPRHRDARRRRHRRAHRGPRRLADRRPPAAQQIVVSATCLADDLAAVLPVVAEVVRAPALPGRRRRDPARRAAHRDPGSR